MSDLEPIQQSRLGEIGQLLSHARKEKGMTLEEVSGKTLIRATILKAIEEGDSRPLPEPVYIRGFIRRFGDLVGLNGTELCDSFPWQPSGSVPLSFVTAGNIDAAKPSAQREQAAAVPGRPDSAAVEQADARGLNGDRSETTLGQVAVAAPDVAVLPEALPETREVGEGSGVESVLDSPEEDVRLGANTTAEPAVDSLTAAGATAAGELEPQFESEADQDSLPEPALSRPDPDAAYESRAALFDIADEVPAGERPGAAAADGAPDALGAEPSEVAIASAAPVSAMTGAATSEVATSAAATSAAATPGMASAAAAESRDGSATATTPKPAGVATLPPPPAPVFYREPEQRSPLPWILAIVAAVLGLGIAVLAFGNRETSPTVADEPTNVEQVEPSSGQAAEAPNGTAAETSTPAASAAAPQSSGAAVPADKVVLELEVKGTEDAWMDVRVDGEVKIEGNQVPGFKQRWDGNQEIELATARPDLVWISVNGSPSQPFGQLAEANPVKIAGFQPANAAAPADAE